MSCCYFKFSSYEKTYFIWKEKEVKEWRKGWKRKEENEMR